jgi:uncharacterized protein YjdB
MDLKLLQLQYNIPSNAGDKTVTWSSSNIEVATVSSTGYGIVTAKGPGTTTITATTVNGLTATCQVTVAPDPEVQPTFIYLNSSSAKLKVGGTKSLTGYVSPSECIE